MFRIVRQERLDESKRACLMEAAMDEFAERGPGSASYNKIIERSGLSKGTVYYYFDNKDSLLLTLLDEICDMFRSAIGDLELPDTKEKYWAVVREYNSRAMQFFFENPRVWRILFQLSKDVPDIEEEMEPFHARATRFLDDLVAKGQEIGAVRRDIPLKLAQRLMHVLGKTLSAGILGDIDTAGSKPRCSGSRCGESINDSRHSEEEQAKIKKFISTMHDLGRRILTSEEDLSCFTRF